MALSGGRALVELAEQAGPAAWHTEYVAADAEGRFATVVQPDTYDVWMLLGGAQGYAAGARRVVEGLRVDAAVDGLALEAVIAPLRVAGAPLADDGVLDGSRAVSCLSLRSVRTRWGGGCSTSVRPGRGSSKRRWSRAIMCLASTPRSSGGATASARRFRRTCCR